MALYFPSLPQEAVQIVAVAAIICCLSYLVISRGARDRLQFPPGPPRPPQSGSPPWIQYQELSKRYGPLMSVQNGTATTIIVSSWELVRTHLERKNTIYSHRPPFPFFERVTGGLNASVLPYGETWKAHRTLRSTVLKPSMTVRYRDIQHVEITQLLYDLMHHDSDRDFSLAIRRCIASVFITLAYGTRVEHIDDPEIEEMETINQKIAVASEAVVAGAGGGIVRRLLSLFFPSSSRSWESQADILHTQITAVLEARASAALAKPGWNWAKEIQANAAKSPQDLRLDHKELSHFLGGLYEAAMAPYQALRIIIAAAILFPEAMKRVQDELDETIGAERLPDFADCERLPWTNAFIRESLRWRSLTPLAGPRAAFQEDTCMGYRIPRDATVLVNTYAIDHDEDVFPDSHKFRLERWIQDPSLPVTIYSFGQRGCPGRHMGQDSLFLATARLLWAFDIQSGEATGLDEDKLLQSAYGTSISSFVAVFKAKFVPQSEQHRQVVERMWKAADKDGSSLLADIV